MTVRPQHPASHCLPALPPSASWARSVRALTGAVRPGSGRLLPALMAVLLLASMVSLRAGSQSLPFSVYTTADGLVQSTVSTIYQDSRGFMWFGTWGGVSRYDGGEFWSIRNSALRVTGICEGPGDTLWIGTNAGLALLAPGDSSLRWIREREGLLPSDYVTSLLRDRGGDIWVGTARGLVVFGSGGNRLVFDADDGLQSEFISSLRQDSTGSILVASSSGILGCSLGADGRLDGQVLLEGRMVGCMTVLRSGEILAASVGERAVLRGRAGPWRSVFLSDVLGDGVEVRSMGEDIQGTIWIGTTLGLATLDGERVCRVPRVREQASQFMGAIYRDREDILWFGTESGVMKLPAPVFRSYDYTTGLRGDHVISIFHDGAEDVWLGSYSGAARLGPDGRVSTFGFEHGLPHLAVHSFARGSPGDVWIGTWAGLMMHARGRLGPGPVEELRSARVIRMLQAPDGTIWCGSHGKILRVARDGRVIGTLGGDDGIPDAGVCALFLDAAGTLWFGTDSRGGGFIRDGRPVLIGEADGLPDPWVMSIGQDRRGRIWLGTQRGAGMWSGRRVEPIRTQEEELRSGIVTFVVRDSLGTLWFGTQRGVYAWNDSVTAHLEASDGLIADATRCGGVDPDGNLWIGTVGGLSRLDMVSFLRKHDPPPVAILGITPDGQRESGARTSFEYEENTITIDFASVSFRDERRTEFQWLLAGIDRGWQPPCTQRHARYTHLPWGRYEFLVRARNGRTAWSDPARVAFAINPPFWGTWWFRMLVGSFAAGGVLYVYRRRIRSLERARREEQEFSRQLLESQECERKRIAGELHDGLVQTLLVAKNRSLLAARKADDPARVTRELSEVSGALTDAIGEVREIAHNLRPYQLDRLGLTAALRGLVASLSQSSRIEFTADLDAIDPLFGPDASTTVYRIVQEASTNILKHSCASAASITARCMPGAVEITVSDNGRGFGGDDSGPPAGGFGMSGIVQRATLLGGTAIVAAGTGGGTTIRVTIPAGENGEGGR